MSQGGASPLGEIFIVDDDPAIRQVLSIAFSNSGYEVVCFAEGEALLASVRTRCPACVVLDVHIPGKSGLDILKELNSQGYVAPIFIMSGKGDIPMAVEAIRNGALDFIEKPFRGDEVVRCVVEAIAAQTRRQTADHVSQVSSVCFPDREPLTRREADVLEQIVAGASNKEAGQKLGISPRTIEVHRGRIMEKLGAKNAADLVRIVYDEGRGS